MLSVVEAFDLPRRVHGLNGFLSSLHSKVESGSEELNLNLSLRLVGLSRRVLGELGLRWADGRRDSPVQ